MKAKTKNATKLAGWRAKLTADGGRVITTALSPNAVAALDQLKAWGGSTTRDVLEDALKVLITQRRNDRRAIAEFEAHAAAVGGAP